MSRRALTLLFAATLVAVGFAIWTSLRYEQAGQTGFKPGPLFADLAQRSASVAQIDIATRDSGVRVRRAEGGRWVVASKDNYPANPDLVHRTIFGLIQAKATDRATVLPENHRKLGLVAPDKGGAATRVVLLDEAGSQVAALLIGNPVEVSDVSMGPQPYFVRKAGDDQVWMAEGDFPVPSDARSWLDPTMPSIVRARIQSTTVRFPNGDTYAVSRKSPDQPDFIIHAVPAGREPAPVSNVANALGNAPSALTFDDVRPKAAVAFPASAEQVVYRTFDGLEFDIALAKIGDRVWATFAAAREQPNGGRPVAPASGAPSSAPAAKVSPELKTADEVKAEIAEINARTGGWAYLLPQPVAQDLTHPLEDLLVPLKQPASSAPGAKSKPAPKKPATVKAPAKPVKSGKPAKHEKPTRPKSRHP